MLAQADGSVLVHDKSPIANHTKLGIRASFHNDRARTHQTNKHSTRRPATSRGAGVSTPHRSSATGHLG